MIPVTKRAVRTTGPLSILLLSQPTQMHHIVPIRGGCPVSGNPIFGLVSIRYTSRSVVEIVTLRDALRWARSGDAKAPRSVEDLAAWTARTVADAVSSICWVRLVLLFRPGPQLIDVTESA